MEDFDDEHAHQQPQQPSLLDFFGEGAGEFLERLDGGNRARRRARAASAAASPATAAAANKPTNKNRRAAQEPSWRDRLADLMANMGGGLDDLDGGDGGDDGGSERGDDDDGDGFGDDDGDDEQDEEQDEERQRPDGDDEEDDQEEQEQEEDDNDNADERPQRQPTTANPSPPALPATLDRDLSTPEVLERIEALCCRLLERLVRSGQLPALQMLRAGGGGGGGGNGGLNGSSSTHNQSRGRQHAASAASGAMVELSEDEDEPRSGEGDDDQEQDEDGNDRAARRRRLSAAANARGARCSAAAYASTTKPTTNTRDMTSRNGIGAMGVARVLRILAAVHEQLRAGRTSTQRDLYYHLVAAQQQKQRQHQQATTTTTTTTTTGALAAAAAARSTAASGALFRSAADVSIALQDAVALLRVPRSLLGVACCGKGAVAGAALSVRETSGGASAPWLLCSPSASPAGRALPGDTAAASSWALRVAPGTAAILVVEKDAVFQRLLQDGLGGGGGLGVAAGGGGGGIGGAGGGGGGSASSPPLPPVILVTARGFPDVATRCFLRRLVDAAGPQVPVLGLVDWNPAGVAILAAYRFGGVVGAEGGGGDGGGGGGGGGGGNAGRRAATKMGASRTALEAAPYALPELRWLGVTAEMLGVGRGLGEEEAEDDDDGRLPRAAASAAAALAPLSARDRAMAANLRARLARAAPAWAAELRAMECPLTGGKADIEALYRGAGDAGSGGGGGGGAGEEDGGGRLGGGGGGGGLAADVAERIRWRRCI